MMRQSLFVTGTDTEIGKTLAACALLRAFAARGLSTAAMKPIAAGAEWRDGAWHNEDVDLLAAAASVATPRELSNPYLLTEPAAPHLVAEREGVVLDIAHIVACHARLTEMADITVVEGVGGFRVPLDQRLDTADLAVALGLPVILVVGMRLGCLSHALLSAEAIAARGLTIAGWIANCVDPDMRLLQQNIDTLRSRFADTHGIPLLGTIPPLARPSGDAAASYIDVEPLLRGTTLTHSS